MCGGGDNINAAFFLDIKEILTMGMTKREKYDAMKKDGAKLRAFNTLRGEEVDELYRERFGGDAMNSSTEDPKEAVIQIQEKAATAPSDEKKVPPLYFDHGGWCNELGKSFFKGFYHPTSWKEYQYLLPHASKSGVR